MSRILTAEAIATAPVGPFLFFSTLPTEAGHHYAAPKVTNNRSLKLREWLQISAAGREPNTV
jgi:hypothetical protein